METISRSSASCSSDMRDSSFDDHSVEQRMFFSDTLKDLKNLRVELYSAAEYFEFSYMNDDQKQIVVTSLKDYATKALMNAMDHLGSVSYEVNSLVDDRVNEISTAELRVSCIEQRMQTCQEHIDQQGLSEQSLMISTPRYYKRYILPASECMAELETQASTASQQSNETFEDKELEEFQTVSESAPQSGTQVSMMCELPNSTWHEEEQQDKESHVVHNVAHVSIRERPPSFRKRRSHLPTQRASSSSPSRKPLDPSPPPHHRRIFITERRPPSPIPSSSPLERSRSMSFTPNFSSPSEKMHLLMSKKSASTRKHRNDLKETEKTSKNRGFLKALLSRRRPREDDMLYAYLDEY